MASVVSWSVRLRRRGGPLVAAALVLVLVLTSCGWVDSAAESVGVSEESEEQDMRVELGPGETYQQQIDEIETFVGAMTSRFGDDFVLRDDRTDTWTPEFHAENRVLNTACSGEGSFRQVVIFDFEGMGAEQARTAGHELAADIGFEPNQAANEVGSDEGPLSFVAVGGGGRSLIVAQQAGNHSIIEVYYRTGCSGHASMQEAYDRFMGERREERREERRQDREERLEELREG